MKRGFGWIMALAVILILSVAGSATADQKPPNYISLKGGIYTPTGDLDDSEFDSGFNGEIAFGRYMSPNGVVEVGIGYFNSDAEFSGTYPYIGTFSEKDEVKVVPLTASAKGILPAGPVEFYIGGGIGLYYVEISADADTSGLGSFSFSDTDYIFGVHVMAGVQFDIANRAFFGIEAKNVWTDEAEAEDTVRGIPMKIETDLNGYMVTANLGIRF